MKFSQRATRILYEFIMLLQDEALNNLPNGIEYYMRINNYSLACQRALDNSYDPVDLLHVGLKPKTLQIIGDVPKIKVLSGHYWYQE